MYTHFVPLRLFDVHKTLLHEQQNNNPYKALICCCHNQPKSTPLHYREVRKIPSKFRRLKSIRLKFIAQCEFLVKFFIETILTDQLYTLVGKGNWFVGF